jgi:hypothetical protein
MGDIQDAGRALAARAQRIQFQYHVYPSCC